MKTNKLIMVTALCGVLALATVVLIQKMDSEGEPGAVADIESGVDISDRIEVIVMDSATDSDKGVRTTLRLKNISDVPLLTPLSLVIGRLDDPKLKVLNADGVMQDALPYYQAAGSMLEPGAMSGDIKLQLGIAQKHRHQGGVRRYVAASGAPARNPNLPFEYRIIGQVPMQPLQPRSYPYALEANSGKVEVAFKVNVVGQHRARPQRIELRQLEAKNKSGYKTYELQELRQDTGLTGIYTAKFTIDTNDYQAGDCIEYQAVTDFGSAQVESSPYKLCITGLPARVADSDTSPGNLLQVPGSSQAVADELLVRFTEGTSESEIISTIKTVDARVVGGISPRNLYQIKFAESLSLSQMEEHIKALRAQPKVESAYFNMIGGLAIDLNATQPINQDIKKKPGNTILGSLFSLAKNAFADSYTLPPSDPQYSNQHGLKRIRANDVWEIGATGAGVTVTTMGTGIRRNHPDFQTSAGTCKLVGGCSGNTDTGNYSGDSDTPQISGFGTGLAGIVGAAINNTGIVGVAPDSMIKPFQVSSDITFTMTEIVQGLEAVAASSTTPVVATGFWVQLAPPGVDLPGIDQWDLCAAINDIVLNGTTPVAIVISAAGHVTSGSAYDGWHYPSKCNDNSAPANARLTRKDLLIPVMNSVSCTTGCTQDVRYAATSPYGAWVDIAAPGTNIITTSNTNAYYTSTGTFFSAAIAAGAAAQLLSCGVPLTQIESVLKTSANVNVTYPGGSKPRIDVYRALSSVNHTPTALAISNSSINENTNTAGGVSIGTLSVTDSDTCDKHSYSIVGGSDAAVFSISGVGGKELFMNAGILDYEAKSSYQVTVRVTDFFGKTFDRALTINVNNLNEAPLVNITAPVNGSSFTALDTIAFNGSASDPESGNLGSGIQWSSNVDGALGTGASIAAALSVGTHIITAWATDSGSLTGSATISLTVNSGNVAPVAVNDNATTDEDIAVTIPVLANDSDVDSPVLTVTAVTQPANGTVAIAPNGLSVIYTPGLNFNGSNNFGYTVGDGEGGSVTATVTVTVNSVNDNPVVNNDAVATNEDTALAIQVLNNDSDVDGGSLVITSVTQPANGSVIRNAGNTAVIYTPNANFNGTNSFGYTVSDGNGGSASGTVTVTVNPVNDAPVAVDDSTSTAEDTAINIPVLANDTDIDDSSLSVLSVTQPANGTVAIAPGGLSVIYTPALNFNGSNSFGYTVSDGSGGNDIGQVTITITPVNDPPVAVDDAATITVTTP
jgi:hypothetical protein